MLVGMVLPDLCLAKDEVVGVLLSREISPYVTMVEGLEARLGNLPVQRFFLDEQGKPYSLGDRGTGLNPAQYSVLVAVGPEALRYLIPRVGSVPLVYGMVLSPEKIAPQSSPPCGVSLNLPVKTQLTAIRSHFPEVSRLGVMFDPENNQGWFDNATAAASTMGMQLVPLRVNRQDGKFDILGDFSRVDVILFIPDKTIISKAIVEYVIKQSVLRRIPVVGYNQFFLDSGAALSFIIDYSLIGRQVAEQVQQLLDGNRCQGAVDPLFATRVNQDALRVVGQKPAAGSGR